jgi:acyl carrier protein
VPDRRAEILAEIRRIFVEELQFPGAVEPRHALAADLELDSMGALVLAVGLEDRFRVKLAEDDATSLVTIADLVALVERALAEAGDGTEPRPVADEGRAAG